jgi:hypothetical protein
VEIFYVLEENPLQILDELPMDFGQMTDFGDTPFLRF